MLVKKKTFELHARIFKLQKYNIARISRLTPIQISFALNSLGKKCEWEIISV